MTATNVLNYIESGNGYPLVLIHGFCESKEIWNSFREYFSTSYRVICPDLPGFGESPLKKKEITIEYMAEKVNDLLVHLGIDQCVMVGHSLGGYVSLAYAEKYESKLKALGLFHSTAYPDSADKRKTRNKTIEFVEKHGSESFAISFVPPLFYQLHRERLKEEIEAITAVAAATSKESIIATTKAMRDRKSRISVLQNIKVPVLFIIGEEDTAIPVDSSLEQASIPAKSVKHILSQTGHMGMFEKKEDSIKIIEDFLQVI
jgi:pimeloyl-ACP methyl ester carboxylesterase